MSSFVPRLTAPDIASNRYYRYPGYYQGSINGVNDCLLINSSNGSVLPNCVGYAWGRAYELLGYRPALCQGDAYLWYTWSDGYERGSDPKPGAIACMTLANPGHVAVVEEETIAGREWTISESIYNGAFFRLGTIAKSSGGTWFCWYDDGQGGSYNPWDVRGFIYPPYDWYQIGEFKFYTLKKRQKKRRLLYV